MDNSMTDRIMRLPEVMKTTGKCRSSVYADIKAEKFPRQRKIGKRSVGWSHSEIQKYIQITLDGGEYFAS